jgi:type I restriction enzyme S subunit
MNAERLLEHYEKIAEAPDAIPKLRRFILDLAVRGKLTKRDSYKYDVKRLGEIATLQNGYAFKSEWFAKTGIRLLRNVNVGHGRIEWQNLVCLEQSKAIEFSRFELNCGDIVLSLDRPFITTGTKVARVVENDLPALLLQRVGRFVLSSSLDADFLYLWITSPHFSSQIDAGRSNGVPHISSKQVENAIIPLPSLAEQQRIVAKVDELMGICDRLEVARKDREAIRDGFTTSTLGRLSVADESTFRSDASFAIEHLRELTTRPDQIKQLRQTILNLAVRGKLVPQDPNDEPAAELLKRIDRQSLIGKKTRNTNKNNSESQPASTSVTQYDLPDNWVWASFEQVAVIKSNLVNPKNYKTYPHIAPDTIESETGKLLPFATVGESGVFSAKHYFKSGSLLYSKIRPALAKVVSIDIDGLCSADMYPIHALIDREYLKSYMLSDIFVTQSTVEDNRVAMPKINQHALAKILVAVPPIKEQKRIVGALDVIWVHLDSLKSSLVDVSELKERYSTTNIRWYCV